jgi:hypothetical protein
MSSSQNTSILQLNVTAEQRTAIEALFAGQGWDLSFSQATTTPKRKWG